MAGNRCGRLERMARSSRCNKSRRGSVYITYLSYKVKLHQIAVHDLICNGKFDQRYLKQE